MWQIEITAVSTHYKICLNSFTFSIWILKSVVRKSFGADPFSKHGFDFGVISQGKSLTAYFFHDG
jgi:hypothetical protein